MQQTLCPRERMQYKESVRGENTAYTVRGENAAYTQSGQRMQHILCQGR